MSKISESLAAMNALPDISGSDSERLREFMRVTALEVKAVNGVGAATSLEMIGYIRELEHENTALRAQLAQSQQSQESILDHNRSLIEQLAQVEKEQDRILKLYNAAWLWVQQRVKHPNSGQPPAAMTLLEMLPLLPDAMRSRCVVHLQATADALDLRQETECPSGTAFNSEATLRRRIAVELESLPLEPVEQEKR